GRTKECCYVHCLPVRESFCAGRPRTAGLIIALCLLRRQLEAEVAAASGNFEICMAMLPILENSDAIKRALAEAGALVLCAPPGTGKSTQVPRLLIDRTGKILVLQPRRIA